MSQDLNEINEKLDVLLAYMNEQQSKQRAMDELKDDMLPIANHMIKLTIDELAEIGTEFRGEDLLFLIKRLLRNTNLLIKLVDQLEGIMGLADEADLLGKQVFNQAVMQLDQMEQKGYFRFASDSIQLADRVVGEIDSGDMEAVGDMLVGTIQAAKEPIPKKAPSMLALARQMNDPEVRTGLARMLSIVKAIN